MTTKNFRTNPLVLVMLAVILSALITAHFNSEKADASIKYSSITMAAEDGVDDMKDIETHIKKNWKNVSFLRGGMSSYKKLDARKSSGKRYVTVEKGIVTDSKHNGESLDFPDGHNYISYKKVDGVRKGSIVITYCIWCRTCNAPDHIVRRYDVVLVR